MRQTSPGTPAPQGAHRLVGAWPSARTASAWPALSWERDGEGVGRADRPGTPHPQGAHRPGPERGLQPGRQTPGQRGWPDQTVKVWDAQTGQELLTLKGHTGTGLRAWPSARTASAWPAAVRVTTTVKVWDAQTGQELAHPQGAYGRVTSVAFSPDGKRLASAAASDDGRSKVWDAADRPGTPHPQGARRPAPSVAFSPDGKRLAQRRSLDWGPTSQGVGRADRPGTAHPQGAHAAGQQRGLQPGRQTPGQRCVATRR